MIANSFLSVPYDQFITPKCYISIVITQPRKSKGVLTHYSYDSFMPCFESDVWLNYINFKLKHFVKNGEHTVIFSSLHYCVYDYCFCALTCPPVSVLSGVFKHTFTEDCFPAMFSVLSSLTVYRSHYNLNCPNFTEDYSMNSCIGCCLL